MPERKKILVIALSDLRFDARVRRQVEALKQQHEVIVAAFNGEADAGYQLFMLRQTPLTLFRKMITSVLLVLRFYKAAHRVLHDYEDTIRQNFDKPDLSLIIANDVETLPIAFSFDHQPKVFFDAHEYAPRHFEDKLMWRIFFQGFNTWMCRRYLPKTSAMMTVGNGLAREYAKNFGVNPVVVPNANNYADLQPSPMTSDKIRLVHAGIANTSRRLELMIEMMAALDDRFTLDLYLLLPGFASSKTKEFLESLKKLAEATGKVRVLPPIKSTELVQKLNAYDMGVFLLPPINFNYTNALPNKLFDFIQARLGIAIGPTPEMAEVVHQYQNGVVSNDFTPKSLASALIKLTKSDIEKFKINSGKAAHDFNAERNALTIQKMVHDLVR